MANLDSNRRKPTKQAKFRLQGFALVAMLILPFFLYLAAQAQLQVVVTILLGLMAVVMVAIILVS